MRTISKQQRSTGSTGREQRLELLARIPELARCTRAELAIVDELGTEVRRPAGALLQRAGHVLRQTVIVLDGSVEDRAGASVLRTSGAGHLVGAQGLTGARPAASSTVRAATPVRLLVFGPAELGVLAELSGIRAWATGAATAPVRVPVLQRNRVRALTPSLG